MMNRLRNCGYGIPSDLELRPNTEIPSPDTLLRGIKELAELDIHYTSQKGASYAFNKAEQLNSLMLDMLLQTEHLYEEMTKITDRKNEEINFENYEVTSIPFTSFLQKESYRLVIQRQKRKDNQLDLFDGE